MKDRLRPPTSQYDLSPDKPRPRLLLIDLPSEIHLVVADHLEALPKHALRSTCLHFRRLLPKLFDLQKPLTQCKVSHASEAWNAASADYDGGKTYGIFYSCQQCLRLRKLGRFADRPVSMNWACKPTRPQHLFCVDCGMKPIGYDQWGMRQYGKTPYERGQPLTIDRVRHIVCYKCGRLKEEDGVKGRNGLLCKACKPKAKGSPRSRQRGSCSKSKLKGTKLSKT